MCISNEVSLPRFCHENKKTVASCCLLGEVLATKAVVAVVVLQTRCNSFLFFRLCSGCCCCCCCRIFSPFQLRQLEERLLDTISAVQGTILDDDTVVQALEDLKGEAGDVAKEVRGWLASVVCGAIWRNIREQCTPGVAASCFLFLCFRYLML